MGKFVSVSLRPRSASARKFLCTLDHSREDLWVMRENIQNFSRKKITFHIDIKTILPRPTQSTSFKVGKS